MPKLLCAPLFVGPRWGDDIASSRVATMTGAIFLLLIDGQFITRTQRYSESTWTAKLTAPMADISEISLAES